MDERVEFGVVTGVGLAEAMRGLPEVRIETPYGPPSGPIRLTSIKGRRTALLARRGDDDELQPHLVPYRANIWALASLGVTRLITSAAGIGLREAFPVGTFVIPDQLIDLTTGRTDTFFDLDRSFQVAAADPFDPTLRAIAAEVLARRGIRFRDFGTAAVTEGPRFPTLAESRWQGAMGADMTTTTLLPETTLGVELGMAVMNMSFITGTALSSDRAEAVDADRMRLRITQAATTFTESLLDFVPRVPVGLAPRTTAPRNLIDGVLRRSRTASVPS